jgi:poly(A) polymerase
MRFDAPEPPVPQPRIIPRPEHTVSRRDIDLEALKVLYRLYHAGYTAYLVGGGVRDLLLGKRPKDFDVVTDARPGELRKLFRNSRIIGKRFRLVQVFFHGGRIVEVSTFRRRSEFDEVQDPGHESPPAKDNTFGTPAEDAQRRDLTINGLFYNIGDFSLVDYVDGLEDLKAGRVRVIGDPAVRFGRDPVRMLRVLRHAARLGFAIDPIAWREILDKRHLIRTCPPARVRDELFKDFRSAAAAPFFKLMLDSGLFFAIFPTWERRLGRRGQERLVDLCRRLDLLMEAERGVADSLLWAVFLTPFLEKGPPLPEDFKDLRDFIHEGIKEALGGIEFPRQRHDDVSQILALEARVAPLLRAQRPVPARQARLALYPEAWLLYQTLEAPEADLLERTDLEQLPPRPPQSRSPKPRRRVRRHRGGRGRGRGKGEKGVEGEG